MAIGDDTAIDYTNKIIEVKNNRYTVNKLYSYLMETFDESGQMDDLVPMEAKTPTLYDVINGWSISTLSWDFLYNSAVEVEVNGPSTLDVFTNVRTLGAIQTGTRLYIEQGGTVTFHAYWPFILDNTIDPASGTIIVSTTIPPSVLSVGSLVLDPWAQEGINSPETLGYSTFENGTSTGTFILTGNPAGTYDPGSGTFVVRAPRTGHVDILLQTEDDGTEIEGTTFSTYARKFQDTYDKFTTTGGAVVSNVPVASNDDSQLTIGQSTVSAYTGLTLTWASGTAWFIRSAFDGVDNVHEYALESSLSASDTLAVVDSTIPATIPTTGYLQVEDEVMYYNTWWNGASAGTFGIQDRGTNSTDAVGHLAGKDLSVYMFEYNVLVDDSEAHTLKQIYNWIQYRLLLQIDIDSGSGTHYGWITSELVDYTGTMFTNAGVWVQGFDSADKNYIQYRDRNNVLHTPPLTILLQIICEAATQGGRAALYRLSVQYNPDTYDPSQITQTLIDAVIPGTPYTLSTNIKFVANFYSLARVRKAGRLPFEQGAQVTSAGLTVRATNPEDTIYQAT